MIVLMKSTVAGALLLGALAGAQPRGADLQPEDSPPLLYLLQEEQGPEEVHVNYDLLLRTYVVDGLVDYAAFHRSPYAFKVLDAYIQNLEEVNPRSLAEDDEKAYWINLYNAATLRLVLEHYPLNSIKDIGGLFSSPWKKKVVSVDGKGLSLDDIEHDILRRRFQDARIHFALNCASLGCPPLSSRAYLGEKLDRQLDDAVRRALNGDRWLKVDDHVRVSKIFDWYKGDFEAEAGSVRAYLARYRPDLTAVLLDESKKIKTLEYSWKLNEVQAGEEAR